MEAERFARMIEGSTLNTRFIQPSIVVADNIRSHAIDKELWSLFVDSSKQEQMESETLLITRYYWNQCVKTIEQSRTHTRKDYRVVWRNANKPFKGIAEMVGENQYKVANDQFPMRKAYSYERQSLVHRFYSKTKGIYIDFEALLEGIEPYSQRLSDGFMRKHTLLSNAFSFSYKIFVKPGTSFDEILYWVKKVEHFHRERRLEAPEPGSRQGSELLRYLAQRTPLQTFDQS